jgi:CubicO group peptidase (beta-lactamase class C family)
MSIRNLLLGGVMALAALSSGSAAAASDIPSGCKGYAPQIAEYRKFIRQWIKAQKIPGMTVGFTRDGCFWSEGFGYSDLENGVPATSRSSYRYASIQKSMTATAVLQLAEQGRLDLDAPIQTYVPYYPAKSFPITARQLLRHLGGIAHYPRPEATKNLTRRLTTRETLALFADDDLVAEPGTKFSYSTFGYNLLGAAIEGASGRPYADYMREQVWGPAGMSDTRMDDPAAIIPNRVRGYEEEAGGQLRNAQFVDVSNRFAGGGARGTVPDMLRFMKALNEGKLLSRASLALMYAPARTRDGAIAGQPHTQGYTMGWNLQVRGDSWFVHNDGGQPETSTFILNYPAKNFSFAMAQNIQKSGSPEAIFKLYELILREKFVLQ